MPRALLLFAGVLTVGALLPSSAAAATKGGCMPSKAFPMRATEGIRQYAVILRGPPGITDEIGRDYYVCSDRSGRRMRIGWRRSTGRGLDTGKIPGPVRFAGSYVAVGTVVSNGYARYDAFIRRVNLADGTKQVTDVCPTCPYVGVGGAGYRELVTDLVLTRSGWIAWIADDQRQTERYSVGRRDSRGIAMLARSADIEPNSLAWSGTVMFWYIRGIGPADDDIY
jgi:hypothetical protein